MISSDDALLFFQKWKDEQTQIHVVFVSDSLGASFAGIVLNVDAPSLTVRVVWKDSQFDFMLRNAEFEYADPREAPEILKREAAKYEGCLTAVIPSRDAEGVPDKVSFFEIRDKESATRF